MKTLVAKLFLAMLILVGSPTFTPARAAASRCGSCNTFVVYGGHYTMHTIYLYRGHAHIHLRGAGVSDLDLYVYDSSGESARSVGRSDGEMVHLDVTRSGYFTIKVVNLGSWANSYQYWVE